MLLRLCLTKFNIKTCAYHYHDLPSAKLLSFKEIMEIEPAWNEVFWNISLYWYFILKESVNTGL